MHDAPDAQAVLNQLTTDMVVFRRRMAGMAAAANAVLGAAAWGFSLVFLSRGHQVVFTVGFALTIPALVAAFRGRIGLTLGLVAMASTSFLTWTTLFVPYATMSPLYLVLLGIIVMVAVEHPLQRAGGCLVLVLAAVSMRGGHHLWHGVPLQETATYLFDTVNIFVVALVFTGLHRARRDQDHSRLRQALIDNQHLAQRALEARDAAREANDTKSDFLARMSHELRTPLNAIIGYSELIAEEEPIGEGCRGDLLKVHRSGKSLLGLVDDLLDLTKLEAGQMAFSYERVKLCDLLREAADTVASMAQRNRNAVSVDVCAETVVLVDPHRVRQILLNLLSNAARFTHDGAITLSGRAEPAAVVFEVRDTGVGIDESRLPRLFEPFVQGSAQVQYDRGGTGLGLAICDRLVRGMGGRFEVTSEVGVGSVFTVVLPKQSGELTSVSAD